MADDDYDIFKAAHEGDSAPLIELLRSGAELTADRRELVIKILGGKIKRPRHRQASLKTSKRERAIFERVHELEVIGWKSTAAIRQTQEEFTCGETTVRNALRRYRGELAQTISFVDRLKSLNERKLKVLECAFSLMEAEDKRAVGLSHETPDDYPPDVLAKARSFVAQVTAEEKRRKKVPT